MDSVPGWNFCTRLGATQHDRNDNTKVISGRVTDIRPQHPGPRVSVTIPSFSAAAIGSFAMDAGKSLELVD
jgi:hypothetical protein